jgi:hypothetical protein
VVLLKHEEELRASLILMKPTLEGFTQHNNTIFFYKKVHDTWHDVTCDFLKK